MIDELLRSGLENEQSAHDLVDLTGDAAGWLRGAPIGDMLRKAVHQSMDAVFQRANTPVERLFFGSVVVLSVTGIELVVAHPAETLLEFYAARRRCREFWRLRNEFHRESDKDDFDKFLGWLEARSITVTPEDVGFLIFYQEDCGGDYWPHVALNVGFPGGIYVAGLALWMHDDDERIIIAIDQPRAHLLATNTTRVVKMTPGEITRNLFGYAREFLFKDLHIKDEPVLLSRTGS
jgi:hypothetical protein